jgi:aryl-alcohol dehydrogenase-like predicted oxidoreductase
MTTQSTAAPHTLKLGKTGPRVHALGLGCMGMSGMYGETSDEESLSTIHAAIDAGLTLIDTGDFYGMGHNELLVGRAIRGKRDQVVVSVKFGALRGPDGSWGGMDTRPAAVKNFVAYSLKRLGVDAIDVYRPARLDPNVPIEETVGAISDLVRAGYVKHIGLSEVGAETIARAAKVHPIVDLQIEYSIASRGPEAKLFPALDEAGISATLYGVLSRGLLAGRKPGGKGDYRAYLPRFAGEAGAKNEAVVARFADYAEARGLTPSQLAVAWTLAKRPTNVTLIGPKTRAQLDDMLGALKKPLDAATLEEMEARFPNDAFFGERYAKEQMAHLDSER